VPTLGGTEAVGSGLPRSLDQQVPWALEKESVGPTRADSPDKGHSALYPANGDGAVVGPTHNETAVCYCTLRRDGFSASTPQRGLYRSIEDESLRPLAHLDAALQLRFDDAAASSIMSTHTAAAITASSCLDVPTLQRHRRRQIEYWTRIAKGLVHRADEPFHAGLVDAMDRELDLFG
jgi:hypothetical protein